MDVHEYQAKAILQRYGIAIPPGSVATTPEQAEAIARDLSGPRWAVKAQILAGGRGAVGGVKIVDSIDDVKMIAELMLGSQLTTAQTSAHGLEVRQVYIERGCEIDRSFYIALLVDTSTGQLTLLLSPEPGAEGIEQYAMKHADTVIKTVIDPNTGPSAEQVEDLIAGVALTGDQAQTFQRYLDTLFKIFSELDTTLIEISPLVVTSTGELTALDAKVSFDNNALFRHPEIKSLQDQQEMDSNELAAAQQGLNYFQLDGTIGTMVSGAGLAMATLDAIIESGGAPANFLDVPPMARQAQVAAAFKLLLTDSRLSCILVNVFGGGVMRCDTIADGIIAAELETKPRVPIVVRLAGTNAEIGRKTLQGSGLNIILADELADVAQRAVEISQQVLRATPRPSVSGSLLQTMRRTFSKGRN